MRTEQKREKAPPKGIEKLGRGNSQDINFIGNADRPADECWGGGEKKYISTIR